MLWAYTVDIYEALVGDDYPVVQHTFYGRTRAEALHYFQSHMVTDAFMRDCVNTGRWEQVTCRAVRKIRKIR